MRSHTYTAYFEYFDDGNQNGYSVFVPALPGCVTWGHTLDEARAMAEDAIKAYLESLLKAGEMIPVESADISTIHVEKLSVPV